MLKFLEHVVLTRVLTEAEVKVNSENVSRSLNGHNFANTAVDFIRHHLRNKRKPINFK